MRVLSAFLLVLAALMCPSGAAAQYVRGAVFQSDTGQPVAGAMVVLIDEVGDARVTVVTNEAGRFVMNAREPGSYALKVQRIGFRDVVTPRFEVAAGQTVERDIQAAPQAIVLEGITAEARRRCVTRPGEGQAVATLWQEAGKALTVATITDMEERYRYRIHYSRRELDANTLRVRREETRVRVGHTDGSPWKSLPAERLLSDGFVVLGDTVDYYAPDAHVLLSEGFSDAYCFRIADQQRQPETLIGLAFEPADRRGPPAVRGTLWLDRNTFELRFLEYGYTRVALPEGPSARIGGRVEFERLPNGHWIVRRFYIRMPQVEAVPTPWRAAGSRATPTIVGLIEDGGEVAEILGPADVRIAGASYATIRGVVFDSASALPLAGAAVQLGGTGYHAISDDDGRFVIHAVPEGEYTVDFSHPRTALYQWEPQPLPVSVARGQNVELVLSVPAAAAARGIAATCPDDARLSAELSSVLRGRVLDEARRPLPGATVTIQWEPADGTVRTRSVRSAADGSFVACALPSSGTWAARVELDGRTGAFAGIDAPGATGLLVQDLTLRLTDPQPVVVIVQDHETGRPIADAVVALPGIERRAVTDRHGRVSFDAVPSGRHDIRIEHVAYGSHVRDVLIGTQPETFEVRVPAQAIALAGIEVTVRSVVEEARRTRGVRVNVMDRAEIVRHERTSEHVGHLAQRIPGLRVEEEFNGVGGLRNGICVRGRRGVTGSGGDPCAVIILDNIPLSDTSILLGLTPDAIEAIEFLNPLEAGPRYGTAAGQVGALLVWTRGNGPYAQRDPR